ncbi:MAG: hypothetical protein N2037_05655 [Acidimicrobiales bacterium]|nr:hypothetical protein [Acidimicrobiales bacterium]
MRLLQINPNGQETSALDFHPMITVVRGLGPSGRELVRKVGEAIPRGLDPGVSGLVEAHGVLLDLNEETLRLLDLAAELDVIVDRSDVPGPPPSKRAAPKTGRDAIERFIEETPEGVYPELDAARKRRADAAEARQILQEATDKARATYDEVLARKRQAEAALEVAKSAGPRLRLVVDNVQAEPETDEEAARKAEAEAAVRERRRELRQRLEELQRRLAEVEQGLVELSSIDTRPLQVLLDAIRNPQPIEYVPSERGAELADEYVELTKAVAELEKKLAEEGLDSASAMRRLEEARKELAAAEKAMRKPELTPEDVAELEAAHEAVLEAEKKVTGLRRKAAEKALEEARQREQEILDRIGFPTWTAYVMGASLLTIDHAAEQRLEKARLDLEAAEAHWNRVVEVIENNPEYRELLDRLEDVYLEAYDLLGGQEPEDLEAALRNLQVPKREVTTEELADALAYQLELVGLVLGEGASIDLIVRAAEAFVEEASAVDTRIAELKEERGQLEAEIAAVEAELAELPDVPDLPEESASLEEASASLASTGESYSGLESFEFVGFGEEPQAETETASGSFGSSDFGISFGAGGGSFGESSFGGEHSVGSFGPEQKDLLESFLGGHLTDDAEGGSVGSEESGSGEVGAGDLGSGTELAQSADDERMAQLEAELAAASEEEAEYREWVESREALLDAAIGVESVAVSRLMKVAADLLGQQADVGESVASVEGSSSEPEQDRSVDVDELAFYLVGRLTALRDVSYAGSVPLFLDDALAGFDADIVQTVLDRLEGMSDTVQVIYLTDDDAAVAWAERVGFQRAAVVNATPPLAV